MRVWGLCSFLSAESRSGPRGVGRGLMLFVQRLSATESRGGGRTVAEARNVERGLETDGTEEGEGPANPG